ncbi:MAG: type II toxin-antitoxin system RelE/ParE family toxin [Candidatus Hydrogenedentes bacterium]|nr:type II toxin-antitoxin system RelE/ParE family toxin [Candidatus Hydrogenedentota bacterium]
MEVQATDIFKKWLDGLPDLRARARIQARIKRFADGNPGDIAPVGEGVSEMRIHCGSGYRLYYVKRGQEHVILLAGGDKSSQARDIKRALQLAKEF